MRRSCSVRNLQKFTLSSRRFCLPPERPPIFCQFRRRRQDKHTEQGIAVFPRRICDAEVGCQHVQVLGLDSLDRVPRGIDVSSAVEGEFATALEVSLGIREVATRAPAICL